MMTIFMLLLLTQPVAVCGTDTECGCATDCMQTQGAHDAN